MTSTTLSEAIKLVIDYRGKTPKKLGGDWSSSGYRALSAKNIKTGSIVQPETIRYVDEYLYKKWMKDEIQNGDIFITSEAPFGQIYYWNSDEKIVLSQRIFALRVKKEFCSKYLYYYMTTSEFQAELDARATGTTVIGLRQPELLKCKIKYPPLNVQKQIASILSTLDAKIELNNAINNNLEQQAQALFKSWFVDFEPFGGKMPSDWKVGVVEDIIELYDSQRIPLSSNQRENMEKIYPYYGATSLMDYVDNYIFDGKYLLLGEDGTVIDDKGFPVLQYVWGKFWVNNHAHIIQGKNGFNVETLYLLFKNTNVKSIVTGAVQPKINQANLKSIPTIIPNAFVMDNFNAIIDPLFFMIRNNTQENTRLAELRDALLPKLMSGEIDVSNVNIDDLASADKLSFTEK